MTIILGTKMSRRISGQLAFAAVGVTSLAALIAFNAETDWIQRNGGLAPWLQALGSLFAIAAVAMPVLLERGLEELRARQTVLASAQMALDLMQLVTNRVVNPDEPFSEWWVPEWHVIDEVCAQCPLHAINSPEALLAFVTIRELLGE